MKPNVRILSLVAFMVSLVTSCVNEGLQEPQDASALKMIPSLEEQTVAVEASMEELHDLQDALESNDVKLEGMAAAEQQAAVISKGGASLEEGTLAAFELQKQIARILGPAVASLDSEIYESEFKERFDALELGISKWVGKDFASLYPAALAEAVTKAAVADLDGQLSRQKLYVDALASDVEAGLRNDEKPGELISLAASVQETAANSEKLASELTALASEVEEEYEAAVKSIISDPSGFDGAALKQFNSNVGVELASADNTLESLSARVAACEVQLSAILERLGSLETEIEDLEGLLGMVQSVTFMSKYSEDKAVAYYTMNVSGASDAQGRKPRTPDGTIELQYVVRPASAAAALTSSSMWNNGLKIFGYYAETMTKAAGDFFDFTITNVTADQTTGVATITVNNALNTSFFFKDSGAKVALSLTTGETDLTSKFVEIVPKDKSGTVYLETITLSKDEVEIDEGDELNLSAILSPNNVTNKELVWTSDDNTVASVSSAGRITGTGVGETHVRVTSKGTDEWGNTLSASCKVKVNPAIKLSGPSYVEQGKTADLTLDYPASMLIESKVWYTSDETKVTASNEGVITGVNHTYNEYTYEYTTVTVYCKINDAIVLSHDVKVVVPQPRQVKFNDYADNVSEITMKLDQTVSLAGTVLPAEASTNFRLFYESTAGTLGWIDSSSGLIKGSSLVGDVTVYARVFEIDKHHRFAPGKSLTRAVTVKVEPYWVESVTLPATLTLAPDATATLTPTFTSDVSGKQPTNTSLTWSSSNPSIVSINSTTGEMIAHSVGTVQITATTVSGAASGSEQKSANCMVTVKTPVAPIAIGDYFYSDGTWSTERDNSKTVIGIVFATVNATGTDSHLRADYPECTNGLVVSTVEYTSTAATDRGWSYIDAGVWCKNNGYSSYNDQSNPCGYTNTEGYLALNGAKISSYGYVVDFTLFNSSSPVVTHRKNVAVPETASAWYVPSYKEMQLLYENKEAVNNSINAVSGNPLHIARANYDDYMYQYWISTFDLDNKVIQAFNMTNGSWYGSKMETTSLPVRIILAF